MATTQYRRKDRYRSGLERDFAKVLEDNNLGYSYEQTVLKYKQPEILRSYLVDFEVTKLKNVIIETKGRLTSQDRKKMLLVRDQHPELILVMVFDRSNRKIYKSSPTTYRDWCVKNNIHCLEYNEIEKDIKCLLNITKKKMDLKLSTLHRKK